jgi:hypothetical protein
MRIIRDNACMIDVIAKEAVIKNRAKLEKAGVKTIPYCSTSYNTETNETRAHAHLLFYYKGDTWHYDNSTGSTKVYVKRYVDDILKVTKRMYKQYFPSVVVQHVSPLKLMTNFSRYAKPLPKKYINV